MQHSYLLVLGFAVIISVRTEDKLTERTKCTSLSHYQAVLTKLQRVYKQLKTVKEGCLSRAKDLPLETNEFGTYYFHTDRNIKKSWFGSGEFCREFGMDLVSIESAAENNYILRRISKIQDTTSDDSFYWTGVNNLNNYHTWMWTGTGKAAGYFSWGAREPDYTGSCVNIVRTNNAFQWGDHDCDSKGRFICELKGPCQTFNSTCARLD